ncbi:MAG: hypothetical protein NTX33_19880 [Propionibacteriales bacterium]|nr:hypothetical protein [Propionibacteriales bacterium]
MPESLSGHLTQEIEHRQLEVKVLLITKRVGIFVCRVETEGNSSVSQMGHLDRKIPLIREQGPAIDSEALKHLIPISRVQSALTFVLNVHVRRRVRLHQDASASHHVKHRNVNSGLEPHDHF